MLIFETIVNAFRTAVHPTFGYSIQLTVNSTNFAATDCSH
jgi:hypothetical protein